MVSVGKSSNLVKNSFSPLKINIFYSRQTVRRLKHTYYKTTQYGYPEISSISILIK